MTGRAEPSWKVRFILLFRRRSLDPPSWKNKHESNIKGRHRRDGMRGKT
jgi:hypothetical protein